MFFLSPKSDTEAIQALSVFDIIKVDNLLPLPRYNVPTYLASVSGFPERGRSRSHGLGLEHLTIESALMYDGLLVVAEAVKNLVKIQFYYVTVHYV